MQGPIPAQMERKVLLKLQEKQLPRHAQAGHLRSTGRGWEPQGSGASKTLVARRVRYLPPLFLIGLIIGRLSNQLGGVYLPDKTVPLPPQTHLESDPGGHNSAVWVILLRLGFRLINAFRAEIAVEIFTQRF